MDVSNEEDYPIISVILPLCIFHFSFRVSLLIANEFLNDLKTHSNCSMIIMGPIRQFLCTSVEF